MYKINVIAVGTAKDEFVKKSVAEYAKRLSRFAKVSVMEIAERTNKDESTGLREEAKEILAKMGNYSVALAIEGAQKSSVKFAEDLKNALDKFGEITFVIGGSNGLDKSVKERASELVSFSKMTFPHTLFRTMLFEQLYRAFTILNGGNYHK